MQTMPNTLPIDIVGSSTFGRYLKISPSKTVNMFISDEWLVNYAGWKRIYDFLPDQSAQGRGIFRSIRNNIMVVVINNAVFAVQPSLSYRLVGNLDSSKGSVFIDENLNNQICIVDGQSAYIYNFTLGSLTKQNLPSYFKPNYVCYHQTFFLFGNSITTGDGAAWYVYKYDSPTTIVEQTQLALQTKPDYAIAVERIPGSSNTVVVFGTSVTELWTHVGGQNNYQLVSSVNIDYGCISVSTIASSDKYVMWVGVNEYSTPSIMMLSGAQAKQISTDGINYLLGTIKYPDQSTAMLQQYDGHLFYQLTFYNVEDNISLAYDINTDKFFNLSDSNNNYHPANRMVYFNQNVYFVSLNNGSLYQTGTEFTTYNENIGATELNYDPNINKEIPRTRICTPIRNKNGTVFRARNLQIMIDQGNDKNVTGLSLSGILNFLVTEGPNPDFIVTEKGDRIVAEGRNNIEIPYCPRADLTLSKDSGETWSSTVSRRLHPIGKRKNILGWHGNLGYSNDLTPKFKFWGTSYYCVGNGSVEIF